MEYMWSGEKPIIPTLNKGDIITCSQGSYIVGSRGRRPEWVKPAFGENEYTEAKKAKKQEKTRMVQRKNDDLGMTHTDIRSDCYKWMRDNGIATSRCSASFHIGDRNLPIERFNLLRVNNNRNEDGSVNYSKIGLQSNCIECERIYRDKRGDRCEEKFKEMSDEEIRKYYISEYSSTKRCSKCHVDLSPDNFSVSRRMECGLHNLCITCSRKYSSAVGDRFIVYSPDFNHSKKVKKESIDRCACCGEVTRNLHKDHIFPIAKGGTDHIDNIQMICQKCNLSKSDTILINNIIDIKRNMICHRYHDIFNMKISNIKIFEDTLSKKVSEFIESKKSMTDEELYNFYNEYNIINNMRKDVKRSMKKFREYQNR
jgi:5-methylcytosine-specific restriction endonuclease McrA